MEVKEEEMKKKISRLSICETVEKHKAAIVSTSKKEKDISRQGEKKKVVLVGCVTIA